MYIDSDVNLDAAFEDSESALQVADIAPFEVGDLVQVGINDTTATVDGNTGTLALKFGDSTVSSVSEMNILAEVQYTGDPTQDISENGIFWTIPFECVQNSSTEALKISLFSDTAIAAM